MCIELVDRTGMEELKTILSPSESTGLEEALEKHRRIADPE